MNKMQKMLIGSVLLNVVLLIVILFVGAKLYSYYQLVETTKEQALLAINAVEHILASKKDELMAEFRAKQNALLAEHAPDRETVELLTAKATKIGLGTLKKWTKDVEQSREDKKQFLEQYRKKILNDECNLD